MANWVVRNADGEFMVLGNGDPSLIHSQPSQYSLVDVPGVECPNPRTQKWNGSAIIAKSVGEVAVYDADQVLVLSAEGCAIVAAVAEHFGISKDALHRMVLKHRKRQ